MKRKYLLSIVILVIIVIVFSIQIYNRNIQAYTVMSEVGFRNITYNIIQLEGAIAFQMDNNWDELLPD